GARTCSARTRSEAGRIAHRGADRAARAAADVRLVGRRQKRCASRIEGCPGASEADGAGSTARAEEGSCAGADEEAARTGIREERDSAGSFKAIGTAARYRLS